MGELYCGELAARVGVDDPRQTLARERLLNDFLGVAGFQRDCDLVCQDHAACLICHICHICHGSEINKAPCAIGM